MLNGCRSASRVRCLRRARGISASGTDGGWEVTKGLTTAGGGPPYVHHVNTSTAVDSTPVELTARLAALADPVRLRLVGVLAGGGRCVCDLQAQVPVAANLLSYHLRVLRDAGLVTATRRGRWVDYRLDGGGFAVLWAQASAAGVPMPGDQVSTEWCGTACDGAEVP
jgi:ArsR family transcriptional regulator